MKFKLFLILILLFYFIRESNSQEAGGNFFDITVMHVVRINFEENNFWQILMQNFESTLWEGKQPAIKPGISSKEFSSAIQSLAAASDEDDVALLEASITIDGISINQVGVRLKGFSSYFSSPITRKSMKVDINANNDTLNYFGLKKINLHNGVGDPSLQRDVICYYLMRKAGVAAPRASYVKLYLNDIYWGIDINVEQVDQTFLENNFANGEGNLFKAVGWSNLEYTSENFADYAGSMELKTNEETSDGSDYVNLVRSINQFSGNRFIDTIQKLFYVDYYFKVMAIDIITKNWDSFIQHGRNFYLYHEPVSDLFYWIPWDYNLALDGQFTGWGTDFTDTCKIDLSFSYEKAGTTVNFYCDTTGMNIQSLWWDFGDGTFSWEYPDAVVVAPVHTYSAPGIFPAKMSLTYKYGCYKDVLQSVILVDTAGICPTALTMTSAYYPDDANFKKVYKIDEYCCDCGWDKMCINLYNGFQNISTIDDQAYPIDYTYGGKLLIEKLFANISIKKRYLDIFKFVLDSVYNEEQIFQLINANASLIRPAVYADTNFIFSIEEFEYDLSTVCEAPKVIANLQRFIASRRAGLLKEYASINYAAKPIEQVVYPKDIVINEITANNVDEDETGQSDWIELYNNTTTIISLKDFGISDDYLAPNTFEFPANIAIKPDGYIIILADKKDKKNNLHADFKLSADGEEVILTHRNFGTIDSMEFSVQPMNKSFARFPNGTGSFIEMVPTFNSKNVKPSGIDTPLIELTDVSFLIYPNPARDFLLVRANSDETVFSVKLFNSLGQKVFEENNENLEMYIDIKGFPNGLYMVELESLNNHVTIKTIINH